MGKLYLIPNLLGETPIERVIPDDVVHIIKNIKVFATENVKNTRRYLKKIDKAINIDELVFLDLNEHSDIKDIETYLPYLADQDMGIISEAGCPGIADPGAELVALAHKHDYQVIPLVGPSSILLALIASGANGQNFSFNGYLPIAKPEHIENLRETICRGEPDTIIYRDPLSERAIIRGYDSHLVSHDTPHDSL